MDVGKIVIGTKIENKTFDKQIKELTRKAEEYSKTLESDLTIPVELRMSEEERMKLESDLEKTKNQIINLQTQADKGIKLDVKKTKKGLEDLTKSVKRFALNLIGIRSIYSLLSKASSSYSNTDEKTTNQIEANWIGLGTILSPVIDLIIGLMKKAVTSILYFMEILTGTNYIAKANSAILKKQSQSMNNLSKNTDKASKSLQAFDEANILTDNKTSSTTKIDTSSLFDIQDLSESTRSAIEKIGQALQPVYNTIKDFINLCVQNPDVVIGVLGGIALLSTLAKIIGVAGTGTAIGTGLAGVLGVLLAIASIGVIVISIKAIYDSINEAKIATDNASQSLSSYKSNFENYIEKTKELGNQSDTTAEQIDAMNTANKNMIDTSLILVDKYSKQIKELDMLNFLVYKATGEYDGLVDSTKTYLGTAYQNLESWEQLYKQGKLNDEQIEDYKEGLQKFKDAVGGSAEGVDNFSFVLGLNKEEAEDLKKKYYYVDEQLKDLNGVCDISSEKIDDVGNAINNIPNSKSVDLEVKTENAKKDANDFFTSIFGTIRNISSTFSSIFKGQFFSFKIPKLASGGIVNNPGRGVPIGYGQAIAGEAGPEAVLPLNDETLSMLGQYIGRHITINTMIDNNIDGKRLNRVLATSSDTENFSRNR